ncbi:HEAT repeat domain-containing protein [Lyngbya sp. CCY1209]|uniref:HEAT repeat domain-containing protein n=1 Tax=Lyngbya sp. CCY1209 TaxID=2886103 RepID=UPI002D2131A0|nr:HEAT repeat domain-containing protein [Lyngbya sp. CCY1209]MEB3887463.1 HEAT repeat domain-containing protein [Lyngbya sp. CCY1209]
MEDDELSVINFQPTAESPLDNWEEEEAPKPDPEEMLPLLESPEPQHRMIAARAFCELQDDRAIAPLIHLLQDSCPLVRVSVAYALGRNPSPDAVEPLIDQYNRDWNGYVRKGLVWALGNCRDARALDTLLDALKTDIPAVRLWAASSLGQMAKVGYDVVVKAVPPVIEALRRDEVAAVRSNCAWSLGQLSRELPSNVVYAVAIDALIESLEEDDDLSVRDDAKSSLLRVGDPRGLQIIEELQMDGLI